MSEVDAGTRAWECVQAANIVHTWALAIDAQDPDAVLACFTPDAEVATPTQSWQGHEAIADFFAGAWAADQSAKRHFIASPRTTWLEPGRVRLEAYFLFVGQVPDQSVIGWGQYDDIVDVRGPEPKFVRVAMQLHLHTDLAAGWPLAVTN